MKKYLLLTTTLVACNVTPAFADPISMAVASMASAAATGGGLMATFGSFGMFGLSLTGGAAVFAHFAIRAAMGYALNALAPSPGSGQSARGYTANELGATMPHAIVYGTAVVGGAVFYQTASGGSNSTGATNNRYFHRCIAFAAHEIQSFEVIYIDGEVATIDGSGIVTSPSKYAGGYIRIKEHLGSDTQTADSDLVSEVTEWTTQHRAQGVAYLAIRFDYDTSVFTNGIPTITAKVKGKALYDPRAASTLYAENPALCLYDYYRSDYGLNEEIADINEPVFNATANICDESVTEYEMLDSGMTPDVTAYQDDTVPNSSIVSTADVFFAVDLIINDGDTGVIYEQGGVTRGVYLGMNGSDLVFHRVASTGNGTITVDPAAYLGKEITLFGEVDLSGTTIKLWVHERGDKNLTLLGTDTAGVDTQWTGSNGGAVGTANDEVSGSYDETNFTGTITEFRLYNSTSAPVSSSSSAARYTCNGSYTLDNSPQNIVRSILASMGGMTWFSQGQWGCKAASYTAATIAFDENDLRGNVNIATKMSRRDNFNVVKGTFRGDETEWVETDYERVTGPTFVAEDGGVEVSTDLPLTFTDTESMARRIATIMLKRNRQQVTVSAPFGTRAMTVAIGDIIHFNNSRLGWVNKEFEVVDWRFGLSPEMVLIINMSLREIDATVFA